MKKPTKLVVTLALTILAAAALCVPLQLRPNVALAQETQPAEEAPQAHNIKPLLFKEYQIAEGLRVYFTYTEDVVDQRQGELRYLGVANLTVIYPNEWEIDLATNPHAEGSYDVEYRLPTEIGIVTVNPTTFHDPAVGRVALIRELQGSRSVIWRTVDQHAAFLRMIAAANPEE